jgi:2-polyprenyl-3-methyl-5-hydroxy-6-metoxy-1,4-benzoquinol methylase
MIYRDKKELINALIDNNSVVLDVGFWGQGTSIKDPSWPHRFLMAETKNVYGIDMDYDESLLPQNPSFYRKGNAEDFDFGVPFSVIFAGDLIEHLSNPGSFLAACKKNLTPDGRLILTTPNCFNLFNLMEKISKYEPTVDKDHTMYFNTRTLKKLLEKNGFSAIDVSYVYTLNPTFQESIKKRILNMLYFLLSKFTDKYMETLVIVAVKQKA